MDVANILGFHDDVLRTIFTLKIFPTVRQRAQARSMCKGIAKYVQPVTNDNASKVFGRWKMARKIMWTPERLMIHTPEFYFYTAGGIWNGGTSWVYDYGHSDKGVTFLLSTMPKLEEYVSTDITLKFPYKTNIRCALSRSIYTLKTYVLVGSDRIVTYGEEFNDRMVTHYFEGELLNTAGEVLKHVCELIKEGYIDILIRDNF